MVGFEARSKIIKREKVSPPVQDKVALTGITRDITDSIRFYRTVARVYKHVRSASAFVERAFET